MSITVKFQGLCGFAVSEAYCDVFLSTRGKDPHHPVLSVNLESVDLTGTLPDHVGAVEGVQIGFWLLKGRGALEFGKPDGTKLTWLDRKDALDLRPRHPKNPAKKKDDVGNDTSVLTLHGGALTSHNWQEFIVTANGVESKISVATAIDWTIPVDELTRHDPKGKKTTIRFTKNAAIGVTNVAKVKYGLPHFHEFYTLLDPPVAPDDQIKLKRPEFNPLDEPVFDCVPPTGLP